MHDLATIASLPAQVPLCLLSTIITDFSPTFVVMDLLNSKHVSLFCLLFKAKGMGFTFGSGLHLTDALDLLEAQHNVFSLKTIKTSLPPPNVSQSVFVWLFPLCFQGGGRRLSRCPLLCGINSVTEQMGSCYEFSKF